MDTQTTEMLEQAAALMLRAVARAAASAQARDAGTAEYDSWSPRSPGALEYESWARA